MGVVLALCRCVLVPAPQSSSDKGCAALAQSVLIKEVGALTLRASDKVVVRLTGLTPSRPSIGRVSAKDA